MERLISTITIELKKHCYDWLKIQNYKVSLSAIGLILWLIKRREVKDQIYRNLWQVRSCNYFETLLVRDHTVKLESFFFFIFFQNTTSLKKSSYVLVAAILGTKDRGCCFFLFFFVFVFLVPNSLLLSLQTFFCKIIARVNTLEIISYCLSHDEVICDVNHKVSNASC